MTQGFIIEAGNTKGIFGVFEDDGETGYLYLYAPDDGILDTLQIYRNSKDVGISEEDVEVVWSADHSKCGVRVWSGFYGVFDIAANQKINVIITGRDTEPIKDAAWLEGL